MTILLLVTFESGHLLADLVKQNSGIEGLLGSFLGRHVSKEFDQSISECHLVFRELHLQWRLQGCLQESYSRNTLKEHLYIQKTHSLIIFTQTTRSAKRKAGLNVSALQQQISYIQQ